MLELWGGYECTVNRVADAFHDQTHRSGHQHRIDDIERFAELGLQAIRYPLLWERTALSGTLDWTWSDTRLARIRGSGMRPIAGLLHHGSGPVDTHLLDPDFPARLAAYAGEAARRYPWIASWTPINEPLTTARFSALYGHWYPHRTDERSFWAALLNQVDGTRLAMAAIRDIQSEAQLIQTEDLGRTYSTRALAHQTEFDNERRWMTWDLLNGDVTRGHPLFERLDRFGFGNRLRAIAHAPCPPDILGVNHYLTSDRFLDHRLERYPPTTYGGNEFMAFADVEAVRVLVPPPAGLEGILQEAWARYGRPLAVTECHNACTREEQVRWMREAWDIAGRLQRRGVDVKAVTSWALLGAYDWNSLLTKVAGHYEVGAFDVRSDPPRPTALAHELRRLARGQGAPHPATLGEGWWRRDIRLQHRPVFRTAETPEPRAERKTAPPPTQPLLILGATGTLGRAIARACDWRGIDYRLTTRAQLPLDDQDAIARVLDQITPWAVVNAAGWVRVDDAEVEADACLAANTEGAVRLARACSERNLPVVAFSSDLVFDGRKSGPYVESDPTSPLSVYGVSKARAEDRLLAMGARALIVRTAAFFSPYDPHNFAAHTIRTLSRGHPLPAADDLVISPTYVPDLVDAVLDLLIDGETGLRHLANDGALSWANFARRIAVSLNLNAALVIDTNSHAFGWRARRPAFVALGTERGVILPDLDHAIARFAAVVAQSDDLRAEPAIHAELAVHAE